MASWIAVTDSDLNLKQVAARLGVHYMTAYRYVRVGLLPAYRSGTAWRVRDESVQDFMAGDRPGERGSTEWWSLLSDALLDGDESGAWRLIERALASGHDPAYCYIDMIAGAVGVIGARTGLGELSPAQEPLASAVAMRLVARLGARFRRPGRSRGSVVFGAPTGERHVLPIAIVADLVRIAGYDVLELGADTTAAAFGDATRRAPRLVAVGIGITGVAHLDEARACIAAIRAADRSAKVVVGGQAVLNPEVAGLLAADAWAPDGRSAVEEIDALWRQQRRDLRRRRRAERPAPSA